MTARGRVLEDCIPIETPAVHFRLWATCEELTKTQRILVICQSGKYLGAPTFFLCVCGCFFVVFSTCLFLSPPPPHRVVFLPQLFAAPLPVARLAKAGNHGSDAMARAKAESPSPRGCFANGGGILGRKQAVRPQWVCFLLTSFRSPTKRNFTMLRHLPIYA